jgi:hypothetical protein
MNIPDFLDRLPKVATALAALITALAGAAATGHSIGWW